MSLFGGLDDGVVESIPTLIDEDLENLFAGGEDLFEFLDERVPAALAIPPEPFVTAAPFVAPAPVVESREPSTYTAPVFFPFGKPEPTAPQLKLSGVSSFKKINSRLLQGGALSDREEADAIRELERALGVLGHQKRFLREHKAGLEKWTSVVYGFNMSREAFAAMDTPHAMGNGEKQDGREHLGVERASLREIRVSLKCKGTKRRIDKQSLLAHVDQMWSPRHGRFKNAKKRSSVKTEAEKPAKRGKTPVAKVDQDDVVGKSSLASTAEEIVEDNVVDGQNDGLPGVPDTPGEGGNKLEACNFPSISRQQLLPENLSSEGEDRLGRSSFVPSRSPGPAAKAIADPGTLGVRCDRLEDDTDVLRQRLVQALVPAGVEDVNKSDGQPKPKTYAEIACRKSSSTDASYLLDVAQLSLAQRVLVQLNAVGLVTGDSVQVAPKAGNPPGGRKLVRANAC